MVLSLYNKKIGKEINRLKYGVNRSSLVKGVIEGGGNNVRSKKGRT